MSVGRVGMIWDNKKAHTQETLRGHHMSSGSLSVVSVRCASVTIESGSNSTSTACYPSSTTNTPSRKHESAPDIDRRGYSYPSRPELDTVHVAGHTCRRAQPRAAFTDFRPKRKDRRYMRPLAEGRRPSYRRPPAPVAPNRALLSKAQPLEQPQRFRLFFCCPSLVV